MDVCEELIKTLERITYWLIRAGDVIATVGFIEFRVYGAKVFGLYQQVFITADFPKSRNMRSFTAQDIFLELHAAAAIAMYSQT